MAGRARRVTLSHVFVELPSSRAPLKPLHVSSTSRRENALSRPSPSQMSSSTPPAPAYTAYNKREPDVEPLADQPAHKKHKQLVPLANASDDYPNGFVYCHQCNKKRDATVCIRCTAKTHKGRRCNAKYCKSCLKNRYGLVLEDILADGESANLQGYHFRCPRCDDVCNCVACRKAKGLQPTGNLTNTARQSGLTSVADVLLQDPKAAGPMAHKPTVHRNGPAPKHGRSNSSTRHTRSSRSMMESKAKPAPKTRIKAHPKPKMLAKPTWTCVCTTLSLTEAEERINIREFALRFSSILELSRSHLDELDEIRPSRIRNPEEEDDDLVPWVSEACLKSLLVGLLSIVDAKGDREKHLKAAVKSIRESGAQLNKMWAALATFRDRQENVHTSSRSSSTSRPLSFPDPLPPPESVSIIRTRSGANKYNTGSISVLRTAQLVPVISAFVDAAVESEAIRLELETGVQESKERTREMREAHRIENERFEHEKEHEKKSGKRLDKSRTAYHKRIATTIEDALKVASYAWIPRISPLGKDIEGRVYWALTPGMNEREDALDLLKSYSQGRTHKSRSRRRPLVPCEEDRSSLKNWSWFIAVWGKRPPITERTVLDDYDSEGDEDEDDDEERWWGFWKPEEIMKLASWVHSKASLEDESVEMTHRSTRALAGSRTQSDLDVDMDDSTDEEGCEVEDDDLETSVIPTKSEVATVVEELEHFASLLAARINRDEETEDSRPVRK